MKLPELMIELGKVPDDLIDYLLDVASSIDLHNSKSLTQEDAFYNAVYRYDATTDFFTPNNYFGSLIPPVDRLRDQFSPLYNWLLATHFKSCVIFRTQLLLSPPGAQVKPHIDPRSYHGYAHRVHVVLKTNNGCRNLHFIPPTYDIVYAHMKQGYLYDLDNIIPHAAFNYGTEDRIHIVIDIMPESDVLNNLEVWKKDTNITPQEILDQYDVHVSNITNIHGDENELRRLYKASIGKS